MSEEKPNRTKNIIIALLVLAVVIVGYLLTKSTGDLDAANEEIEQLVYDLEAEQSKLKAAVSDNDSMSTYIEAESARLAAVIDSIETERQKGQVELGKWKKRSSYYKNKYNKLLAQNDSINKAFAALQVEKEQVEDSLQVEVVKNQELTDENRDLNRKTAVGSMLQLSKMEAAAYKVKSSGKEKETTSSGGANRIKACFTIAKNLIAEKGERVVYMRVTTPDLTVFTAQGEENKTFNFNGKELFYSAKQPLYYDNDIIESCVNLNKEGFKKGEYNVELYTEGYKLGEAKVVLN